MRLGGLLDDGEAKARAAGVTGAGGVDATEALEDAVKVLRGDAAAVIGYAQFRPSVHDPGADGDDQRHPA